MSSLVRLLLSLACSHGLAALAEAQAAPFATPVGANQTSPRDGTDVPFRVGEELTYKVTFGVIRAGVARMRVDGIEEVRGRPAYHVILTLDGGIPFFRVHDRYDSWIDVATLSSLRHRQEVAEGRYRRVSTYELFPERAEFAEGDSVQPSVSNPLDDASLVYAIRGYRLEVGESRTDQRYFRPERNPVVLTAIRRDTVQVGAGTFATIVVRPTIRTRGLFNEGGEAELWLTDDDRHYPVQVRSTFARFSLRLTLESVVAGDSVSERRQVATSP